MKEKKSPDLETIEIIIPELESAPDYIQRNRPWTPYEEAVLKKYFGKKPTELIAKTLNRSRAAIAEKARHMGLKMYDNT